jgi:hypothetical protein
VIAITAASSIKRGPAVRDIGSFVSGKHGRPKRYVETNFYIYASPEHEIVREFTCQ